MSRRNKSQSPKAKNRILAVASSTPTATVENKNINDVRSAWVPYFNGSNNTYPNELAERARRSTTHNSIIKSKTNYTVGQGWTFTVNDDPKKKYELEDSLVEFLDNANNDNESLLKVFKMVAEDYVKLGNAYIEIVTARIEGSDRRVMNIFHVDGTKVRINKEKTKAYISSFWRDIKLDEHPNQSEYPIETVDLWNGDKETTQSRYIIHIKNYEAEYDYYGLPEHHAVLNWAEIEYKIPMFNLSEFDNGFFPSALIQLIGTDVPEGMTPKQYVNAFIANYTGEGKNGKIVAQMVDSADQAAQVTEFNKDLDGFFTELQELATKNIIGGHRWYPSLSGQITTGGMGQSSTMIINDWSIAMANLVIPEYQTPLLELFNMVVMMAGFDVELGIKNKPPVTMQDTLDAKLVLTVNEQRKELGLDPLEEGGDELIKKENDQRNGDNNG